MYLQDKNIVIITSILIKIGIKPLDTAKYTFNFEIIAKNIGIYKYDQNFIPVSVSSWNLYPLYDKKLLITIKRIIEIPIPPISTLRPVKYPKDKPINSPKIIQKLTKQIP